MKVFVSGATGFQGGAIAKELIQQGHHITTLSSRESSIDTFGDSFEVITGGFDTLSAINGALNKVDVAVFTYPLAFDLEQAKFHTLNFITAALDCGVSLVIFNTGFHLPKTPVGLLAIDIKVEIKKLFDSSGLKVITLAPDIYLDNLSAPWSIPLILKEGILPYPIASGVKVPWISHADMARFVSAAVNRPDLSGKMFPIGGGLYSGEEIANSIAVEIGKHIEFQSLTPDMFESQISPAFGELAGREISNLYRYVLENIEELTNKDFEAANEAINVKPLALSDWVKSIPST